MKKPGLNGRAFSLVERSMVVVVFVSLYRPTSRAINLVLDMLDDGSRCVPHTVLSAVKC
jgi:hypothetical protein